MKQPLHEILVPIAYFHFAITLIIYMILGMFNPTLITYYWFIPNLIVSVIEVMAISLSRFLDKRYKTLFKKYPEFYKK